MHDELKALLERWETERSDLVKQAKDCRSRGLSAMADVFSTRAATIADCIQELRQTLESTND
jgi:hypothetical protein